MYLDPDWLLDELLLSDWLFSDGADICWKQDIPRERIDLDLAVSHIFLYLSSTDLERKIDHTLSLTLDVIM